MAFAFGVLLLALSSRGVHADCSDDGVCEAKAPKQASMLLQFRAAAERETAPLDQCNMDCTALPVPTQCRVAAGAPCECEDLGQEDGTVETCTEKMFALAGDTFNYKNGTCDIKRCGSLADMKYGSTHGEWEVYSTFCSEAASCLAQCACEDLVLADCDEVVQGAEVNFFKEAPPKGFGIKIISGSLFLDHDVERPDYYHEGSGTSDPFVIAYITGPWGTEELCRTERVNNSEYPKWYKFCETEKVVTDVELRVWDKDSSDVNDALATYAWSCDQKGFLAERQPLQVKGAHASTLLLTIIPTGKLKELLPTKPAPTTTTTTTKTTTTATTTTTTEEE